jgi:hypothetical protein
MNSFEKLIDFGKKEAEKLFVVAINKEMFEVGKNDIHKMLYDNGSHYDITRQMYNENFSWPLLTTELIEGIGLFLRDLSCLSVMSGNGMLEYFLSQSNSDIIATDIKPSYNVQCMNMINSEMNDMIYKSSCRGNYTDPSFHVIKCNSITAVRTYDKDVLLISWPNYGDDNAARTLEFALQVGFRYIIYIGECLDGCCATDKFFEILNKKTTIISRVKMMQFWGIWDYCTIYESTISVPILSPNIKFSNPLLNKKIYYFVYNNKSIKNRILKKRLKKYFDVELSKKHINFLRTLL